MKALGIVLPATGFRFGLVEVDRQEIASVVFQQRINADRVLTGQMVVNHSIGQRDQQAVARSRRI